MCECVCTSLYISDAFILCVYVLFLFVCLLFHFVLIFRCLFVLWEQERVWICMGVEVKRTWEAFNKVKTTSPHSSLNIEKWSWFLHGAVTKHSGHIGIGRQSSGNRKRSLDIHSATNPSTYNISYKTSLAMMAWHLWEWPIMVRFNLRPTEWKKAHAYSSWMTRNLRLNNSNTFE